MTTSADGVWVLIPVKRFATAKSRLAGALSGAERVALAKAMLADMLETVRVLPGLAGALLVTADAEAAAIGAGFGAVAIGDPFETGVDAAVAEGLGWLACAGARAAVVVPGDAPFLRACELDSAASAFERTAVVLAPAIRDGGTNLLGMSPPAIMPTAYGPGSFDRHVAIARRLGIEPAILTLPGAGRDIDVAVDLERPLAGPGGGRTRRVLGAAVRPIRRGSEPKAASGEVFAS
jgi:2-phospho-L-lactate guanylyltransferase